MPRVTPGAKTQAAAQKVVDSDKPVSAGNPPDEAQQKPIAEVMAENDRKNAERAAAAKKPATKPPARAATPRPAAAASKPAAQNEELPSLDESEEFTVLVVYGPAGNRKTTSALRVTKAEPKGKVLVIAAEAGMKPQALRQHEVDTSRVRYWPRRGNPLTYEGLEKLFFQILADLEEDRDSWAAVIWDSLSEVIETLVDNATQADIARLQEIARVAKKDLEIRKVYEREGADYGVVTQQFRQLLRKWRSLPCHQIFVALEEDRKETIESEDGRKTKMSIIGPDLPPKVRRDVEQHADVIMRVSVVDIKGIGSVGVGRSTPAEDMRAKDRYCILPPVMIDPGFERIWGYITGELKADQDQTQSQAAELDKPVLESAQEKAERVKAENAAKAAERRASRPAATKTAAQRRTAAKPDATETPDDSPM